MKLLYLIIILLITSSYASDLLSCTPIVLSGTYRLIVDVSPGLTTCFPITANDVILDLNGHIIDNDRTSGINGISATNEDNISIENGTIQELDIGIQFVNVTNSNIRNVSLQTNLDHGISLTTTSNTNLSNLSVNNNTQDGIHLSSSFSNSITLSQVNSNQNIGILLFNSTSNSFSTSNISSNVDGVYLENNSNDNNFTNNNLNTQVISIASADIISAGSGNMFIGNSFNNNVYAFYILNLASSVIQDNELSNNTQIGIYGVDVPNTSILFNNITIGSYALSIQESDNIIINNNNISNVVIAIDLQNSTTSDISNNIVNQANGISLYNTTDVTLDNNTLTHLGVPNTFGIFSVFSSNINISNELINTFSSGILIENNSIIEIIGSTINNSSIGIDIENTDQVNSESNIVENNTEGFLLTNVTNSVFTLNTVSNNVDQGFFLTNLNSNLNFSFNTLNLNDGGFYDNSSSFNTYSSNTVDNGTIGIYLENSDNILIENNSASGNAFIGIVGFGGNDLVTIFNNNADLNDIGIASLGSTSFNISHNIISNSIDEGIFLPEDQNNSLIEFNDVSGSLNSGCISVSAGTFNNIISNNHVHDCMQNGIILNAGDTVINQNNTVRNNIIENIGVYAIDNHQMVGSTIENNTVSGAVKGIVLTQAALETTSTNHIFNLTTGFEYSRSGLIDPSNYTMTNDIFDNPLGDFTNFTNLSITDTGSEVNEIYSITWIEVPGSLPDNHTSFEGKSINISLGGVQDTLIDELTINWLDNELVGYNETKFQLWGFNGTWNLLNYTLDTSLNEISIVNLVPNYTIAILENHPKIIYNSSLTYNSSLPYNNYAVSNGQITVQDNGTYIASYTTGAPLADISSLSVIAGFVPIIGIGLLVYLGYKYIQGL